MATPAADSLPGSPPSPAEASATGAPEPSGARHLAPAPAGATIEGQLGGRAELVAEIVILGPDSALKQFSRVKPIVEGGTGSYQVSGVPPGRYHVMPMGKGGASLKSRPAIVTVSVTSGAGARADFTIEGAQ